MTLELREQEGVRLAIEGCGHGALHSIYASIDEARKQNGWPTVDLVIIGGDFQAVRNAYDLNCVSMPEKYRHMGDFHEYYSGDKTAPYLTLFVGGNHEASNYLFELYYGGWVAPNIYYMGAANVLRLGPLRIVGLSGIWKGYHYRKPHYERLPYNSSDIKSIYHVREVDVRKLLQIRTQVDIGISHDWPKGVEWEGDWKQLFRFKPYLQGDATKGELGSVAARKAMDWLRPKNWFSAHMHAKYAAVIEHAKTDASQTSDLASESNEKTIKEDHTALGEVASRIAVKVEPDAAVANSDEIDLDLDDDFQAPFIPNSSNGIKRKYTDTDGAQDSLHAGSYTEEFGAGNARAALPKAFDRPAPSKPVEHPPYITNKTTEFLALDKCLPNKHFLQLVSIPTDSDLTGKRPLKLQYDREWLAITRTFAIDEPLELGDPDVSPPKAHSHEDYAEAIDKRRMWVDEHISNFDTLVPDNFVRTAPIYDGGQTSLSQYRKVLEYANPQTAQYCKMLDIPNPFDITEAEARQRVHKGARPDNLDQTSRSNHRGGRGGGRGGFGGVGRGRDGGNGRGGSRGGFRGRYTPR